MRRHPVCPQHREPRAGTPPDRRRATAIGADDLLVLIDQEGGRVQRLRPPHWRALPPAAAYGKVYQRNRRRRCGRRGWPPG